MADFKKLLVWQKAHWLSIDIDPIAARIRGQRHVSLRSQMVRAAGSIPAAIVEGRGQDSDREFARYLRIALNSTSEFEYHVLRARDLGVMKQATYLTLVDRAIEIRKMLHGLLATLDST